MNFQFSAVINEQSKQMKQINDITKIVSISREFKTEVLDLFWVNNVTSVTNRFSTNVFLDRQHKY